MDINRGSYAGSDVANSVVHLDVSTDENPLRVFINGNVITNTKSAISVYNDSVSGKTLSLTNTDTNTQPLIDLTQTAKNSASNYLLKINPPGFTPIHESRITHDSYLQFPAYYHCSDFDEYISGSTALSSSVIAKAYWIGGGTDGTQTLETGATEDESTYIKLSTTSTASRSSTIIFGRSLNPQSTRADIEFRIRVSSITNTTVKMGLYRDATHYAYFLFDSATDANNLYIASKDGAGDETTVNTTVDLTTSAWFTFRIKVMATDVYYYINDTQVGSAYTTQLNDPRTPYFYIDNNDQAEEKILYVDYVKIWQGRDNTQSPII
jgi:hypothetical protein